MPTRQEIIDYITQSALSRGIDPNTVLRVFTQESGLRPNARNINNKEESYGIAQLNVKGGLGAEARRRGIEPSDPNQWKDHVDFSLDTVKRDGWRQWYGARDVGIGRWEGINPNKAFAKKDTINLGSEPRLEQLNPPKTATSKPISDETSTNILRQMGPTEESNMARPSVRDAIRQSMDELGIRDQLQYAGFVPPGLTKGSAKTRADANKGVQPKGTIKDVEAEAKRAEELRSVPNADKQMSGSYADYVRRQKEAMEAEQSVPGGRRVGGPDTPMPPETGRAVVPVDPTLAAQNDPARQALIAAKITGRAVPGSGGPVPRTSSTTPIGRATTAAAATGLGVATTGDPAVDAVQRKLNEAGAAPAQPQQGGGGANVDAGTMRMLQQAEQAAGLAPGTLSGANAGVATSVLPILQKAFRDPATRQAGAQVAKALISEKAKTDAAQADMQRDPTFYQRAAATRQMQPGGGGGGDPIADRAMERAVMMDNAQRGAPSARGMPVQPPRPPAPVPQTTQGTVRVRSTPPEQRTEAPTTEEQIVNQVIPPGAEKGDVPPTPQQRPMTAAQAYPYGYTPPPGAYDPSGGIPAGVPASGQVPMDPAMMQLMQFFMQGGGEGGGAAP
jgi:hypothetical protein